MEASPRNQHTPENYATRDEKHIPASTNCGPRGETPFGSSGVYFSEECIQDKQEFNRRIKREA